LEFLNNLLLHVSNELENKLMSYIPSISTYFFLLCLLITDNQISPILIVSV